MKRGLVVSVVLTLVVCFGSLAAVLALGWKPLLGLDLRGGLQVVYCPVQKGSVNQCETKPKSAELDQVVNIMNARINALGVSQPNINVQGGDVVVQLPGVKNPQKVLAIIGTTAQLYFRPVLCYGALYTGPTTPAKKKSSSTTTTTSSTVAKTSSGSSTTSTTAASSTTSTTKPKSSTTTTSSSTTTTTTVPSSSHHVGPVLPSCPAGSQPIANSTTGGVSSGGQIISAFAKYPTTTPAQDTALANSEVILNAPGANYRYVLGPAAADGTIIKSAYAQQSQGGNWVVIFNLTGPGNTIFNDKIAKPFYLKFVANDLDGVVQSAPYIATQTFNGSGQISGNFDSTSANNLALVLSYGALPVSLNKLTSEIVSPTLGAASLRAGLLAGLLGLLLVMGYTIFYYRALGVVVIVGLISTGALIYAIIAALGHSSAQLTLDLSGITGLIVSVGITVDSYVVYFERLKDEVRAGRSIRSSVDKGFRSAYRTILSADAVSFIGAAVLWFLSVGAVRGFAFMLGLSTLIDVFTAYFFTRPAVILLGRNRVFTEARGLGVARGLAATPAVEGTS